MCTLNDEEKELLAKWRKNTHWHDATLQNCTKSELRLVGSLVERRYILAEPLYVPSETSGTYVEYHDLRLTEKGLLALRPLYEGLLNEDERGK